MVGYGLLEVRQDDEGVDICAPFDESDPKIRRDRDAAHLLDRRPRVGQQPVAKLPIRGRTGDDEF
jgi:hypothetical protein